MSCNEIDLSCGTGGHNGGNSGGSSGMPSGFGGISANGLVGGIRVRWGYPVENPAAVAYVEVHRATNPHLKNATLIAVVNANYYEDYFDDGKPQSFSYWIRYVATNNETSDFIGPASATSFDRLQDYLDNLYGQIDEGVLATQLREKLDGIRLNNLGITEEMIERAKETDALGVRLTEVKGFTDNSLAILQEEVITQAKENSAVGQYVQTLMVEVDKNKAAVQTEKEVRIDENEAFAKSLEKMDIELNGNEVLGEAGLRGMVNDLTGEVYGMWTAKVETNGLIGGFGLVNDGTTVEAGFDVNRFWVGRSGNGIEGGGRPEDGYYPFLIDGNNIAFNGKVSFTNITGEDRPAPYATRNEYQGNYQYNRRYSQGDIVFFQGNGWSARKNHLARYSNRPPTQASAGFNEFWILAAQQGDTPTVEDNGNGTYTISGANGQITIKDGNDGDIPTVTNLGGGEYKVTDPEGNSVTISDGYTPIKNRDYFDGATGNYHSIIYREYAGDLTAYTPSGGSFDGTTETFPSYWSDNPPNNPTHTVWVSRAVYEATVNTDGSESWSRKRDWSVPSKFYEKGEPGPQGVEGQRGDDGAVYYTWIRYADDQYGNGISNDPTNKEFMGLAYNKNTAIESNDKNDYTWNRFRGFDGKDGEQGTQGVRGPQGPDGNPTYTWIVYGTSASGANLHQIPHDNTSHIGIANNKLTATESTDPADYIWSKFKGDLGPRGYSGENGQDGLDGESTVIVYKAGTTQPWVPDDSSDIPYGWERQAPSSGIIWETTGTRPNSYNNFTWSTPRVSADHWRRTGTAAIDGHAIFADDAYVDTLQIKGNAVTVTEYSFLTANRTISHGDTSTIGDIRVTHPGGSKGSSCIILVNLTAYGIGGDTDWEITISRSGWDWTLSSSVYKHSQTYVFTFFDGNPPRNPNYSVKVKVYDHGGGSNAARIQGSRVVAFGGKR